MNHNVRHARPNIRKEKMSSTTPFGMFCLVVLIGIFFLAGMFFYPPGVHAQAVTGTAHLNVAPVELTLTFNRTNWSVNDSTTNQLPSNQYSPNPPIINKRTVQTHGGNNDTNYECIPYEYIVAPTTSNTGANATNFDIQEIGTSTVTIALPGTNIGSPSPPLTNTYGPDNYTCTTNVVGHPNQPQYFAFDSPGPQKDSIESLYNAGALGVTNTTTLVSTPLYRNSAGTWNLDGSPVTNFFTVYYDATGWHPNPP